MDLKKIDQKLGSACDQQSQTIGPQSKLDKAPQRATEQLMAVSPPGLLNQGHVFSQSPSTAAAAAAAAPSSQPQWPGPFVVSNVSPPIYQTFTPLGATYPTWQGAVTGGTSSTTQNSVPNMCYYFGYAFPGPCDPSSWYQLQNPYYNYPVAPGFSSATPTMHGCSASGEHSSQRGIIKPTAKLSQEHHQLWEAQSAENVQLRCEINKLQAEVSDYKGRVTKLEQVISSFKPKVEALPNKQKVGTPPAAVIGTIPLGTGQPRKRGRPPKRSLALMYESQEPPSGSQVRKPAPIKPLFEIKSPIFEKVLLNKDDNVKEIAKNQHITTVAQQQTNRKSSNVVTDVGGNIQSNSIFSAAYQGQIHQQYQGLQTCGSRTALASGTIIYVGTIKDFQNVKSKLPRPHEVAIRGRGVTVKFTGNGNQGLTSCIPPRSSARELLDAAHRGGLFRSSSVFQQEQGAKVTPGGNSENEKDASEELQDTTNSGSVQDEEGEEEMGDDTSSNGEAIGVLKDLGGSELHEKMT